MKQYRITKYNPKKRNEDGSYNDSSEWTSISDIGDENYRNITYEEYFRVESLYIESIVLILLEKNINYLQIDSFENYTTEKDFKKYSSEGLLEKTNLEFEKDIALLKDGNQLNNIQIEKTIRLILREMIWMDLVYKGIKVIFGYDYYMYVECAELKASTIQKIENLGMYVEPNISQIEFEIVETKE